MRKLRVFISLLVTCVIAVLYYTPSHAARNDRNLPTSVSTIGRIEQVAAFTGPMPTGVTARIYGAKIRQKLLISTNTF